MGFLVALVIGWGFGTFALSNVVLPLFWAWPKARKLGREGLLTKPIPIATFIVPSVAWSILVAGSLALVAGVFPSVFGAYAIGLSASLGQAVWLLIRTDAKEQRDMEADFADRWRGYLLKPEDKAAVTSARRLRILLVDDEASVRELLAKTLALAEYDVDASPDGTSALERLRLYPYDLLIANLELPGTVDGPSVIRETKRLKLDLPVIVIAGYSTESAAIEAANLGVAGYLTKPFRVPQVLAAAAKALSE